MKRFLHKGGKFKYHFSVQVRSVSLRDGIALLPDVRYRVLWKKGDRAATQGIRNGVDAVVRVAAKQKPPVPIFQPTPSTVLPTPVAISPPSPPALEDQRREEFELEAEDGVC
jgi:hypothetical protein